MPFTHSFIGVTPPARFDGLPWTSVLVYQSATATTGPLVQTLSIPVDPTPDTPNPVNLTVTMAPLEVGYFVFQFRDAAGTLAPASAPLLSPGSLAGVALCTVAQIDAQLARGGTASAYTEASKLEARDVATAAFERECGVAFSTRTVTRSVRSHSGFGSSPYLELPDTNVQAVSAITRDGVALTAAELEMTRLVGGAVYGAGYSGKPFTVTYTHGFTETPKDVSRAVAILAASILKDGPYDDRGFGVTDDGGSVRLLTAGIAGASFSIPEVQAAVARYKRVYVL